MTDIGINYIPELEGEKENKYEPIYRFLIKEKYINTIKFPGKYCNENTLNRCIRLSEDTGAKIDIHGFPGMIPAIHDQDFVKNINWVQIQNIINNKMTRISTHVGLKSGERIRNYKEGTIEKNIETLKEKFNNIEVGLENIPGGLKFDIQTITPEFVSIAWDKADFGVFDIAHAKLAAGALNMSYEEYVRQIQNKSKVKILHVAGNIDETNKYKDRVDKHVLTNSKEIKDIIKTLEIFENIDLVVSEYATNTKYSFEKELLIESILISTLVKTRSEVLTIKTMKTLEENLKKDISNVEEVLKNIKNLYKEE